MAPSGYGYGTEETCGTKGPFAQKFLGNSVECQGQAPTQIQQFDSNIRMQARPSPCFKLLCELPKQKTPAASITRHFARHLILFRIRFRERASVRNMQPVHLQGVQHILRVSLGDLPILSLGPCSVRLRRPRGWSIGLRTFRSILPVDENTLAEPHD